MCACSYRGVSLLDRSLWIQAGLYQRQTGEQPIDVRYAAVTLYFQKMPERPHDIPPSKLVSALRGFNLLPAIVFLPTRRKCDEAASEVAADKSQQADPERQQRRKEIFQDFAITFPEVLDHKHARVIVRAGVAAHHAGHIPSWKLLIERMMSAGLLNALFATSTV